MFCDNDQCELNKVMDDGRGRVTVRGPDGEKEVMNYKYAYWGPNISFYLCGSCHSAVEFVRNKIEGVHHDS